MCGGPAGRPAGSPEEDEHEAATARGAQWAAECGEAGAGPRRRARGAYSIGRAGCPWCPGCAAGRLRRERLGVGHRAQPQPWPGRHATPRAAASATELHAAAQCIRQHGVPGYQDPVLSPQGAVYSDSRSFQNAPASTVNAVRRGVRCPGGPGRPQPRSEPPAPPQLVQAGVRAAECERAHGLPNVRTRGPARQYTPGHGFGLTGNEVPAGGKASHGFQEAIAACQQPDRR